MLTQNIKNILRGKNIETYN